MVGRNQRGSTLILFIGVVATLATLAAALTILTVNVQGNSRRDRQQKQAFSVSEAALDAAFVKLGQSWPIDEYHQATWSALDKANFRAQFDESVFPDPRAGSFSQVVFYDNFDNNSNGVVGPGDEPPFDKDSDGFLYVEAQSGVGERAVRLQAEVQRVMRDKPLPGNVAVASEGLVYANNQKQPVQVEGWVTGDPQASIWSPLAVEQDVYDSYSIAPPTPVMGLVVDSVVNPNDILDYIAVAKTNGSYYSGSARPASDTGWEGIVAIQTTGRVDVPSNAVLNGDGVGDHPQPGMLIVVGPNYPSSPPSGGLDFNGGAVFYGLVYTDSWYRNTGTSEIHGMLAARSTGNTQQDPSVSLKGDRDVLYNDYVIQAINGLVPSKVRLVPNTWREITPIR